MIEPGTRKVWVGIIGILAVVIMVVALGYFSLLTAAIAEKGFSAIVGIVLAFFGINYLKANGGPDK